MFKNALGIQSTQLPWLQGAFSIANGLSVILSGSLTDLLRPKALIVGAFAWLVVWNCVGAFSITPARNILFFIVRSMQGLAIGVLVSGSMSILGRVFVLLVSPKILDLATTDSIVSLQIQPGHAEDSSL